MCFAHFDTRKVAQHVTFHGDVMVVLGGDEVLPFQVQHLQVVAVGLPQVTQVGPQCQFQLVALQACVLHGDAGIAPLALAVAVEEVEPYSDASVESEVVAVTVIVNIIFPYPAFSRT